MVEAGANERAVSARHLGVCLLRGIVLGTAIGQTSISGSADIRLRDCLYLQITSHNTACQFFSKFVRVWRTPGKYNVMSLKVAQY